MGRLWSGLFLLVPIGTIIAVGIAIVHPSLGWWLPENVSTFGRQIDHLFNVILTITGIAFLLTQGFLVYTIFRFGGVPGRKAAYVHGNHRLEVIWTVVPALILLFLALYQLNTWRRVKMVNDFPRNARLVAEVTARQFEWRVRYPGPDGMLGTADDPVTVNELRIPVNTPVRINLRTLDVIHSFYIPSLRIKQDALPGLTIPVWFDATKPGVYDIACAQLCGWGHYKMRGRLIVEPSEQQWDRAMKRIQDEHAATRTPVAQGNEAAQ